MASTRFYYDTCRINKQVEESTAHERYVFGTPGPGSHVAFETNPYFRLQRYGANLTSNSLNVENDLRGLTRVLTHDCMNYKTHSVPYSLIYKDLGTQYTDVDETRTTNPAFLLLDQDISEYRFQPLFRDYQKHAASDMYYSRNSSRVMTKEMYERGLSSK